MLDYTPIPRLRQGFLWLALSIACQSILAADQSRPYREVYTWFNSSLDKHDEPGLQQISLNDGELVLFTCWRGLAPGKHAYLARIFDATGQEVVTHPLSFPGDKDEWEAWTSYQFRPGSDPVGMWRYEIYLNDRLIEKQELFVDAALPPAEATAVIDAPQWIAVAQPTPEIPAEAAGTGTRGSVGIEVTVTGLDTEPLVNVIQSEPFGLFDQAVFDAVRNWRFAPSGGQRDPGEQQLFYRIRFGDDKVVIEGSTSADMKRGLPFRKVGVADAREAMPLIAGMDIAPGELAYFSVGAEFKTEPEARTACEELANQSSWQPVWSSEGKWLCAVHETLHVDVDIIQSFIDTADVAFGKHRGRTYGLFVQDRF